MKRLIFCRYKNKKLRGQSLVELAITLPLFLMLIGGIVEIGNILVQRQRITTATDMGVRFGSRGGSDTGIYISTYNVLTQTMPIDNAELWDIFVVRGKVNDDGTGWVEFDNPVHVFGEGNTDLYRDIISTTYPITLQTEILNGLQTIAVRDASTDELAILPAGGGIGQSGSPGQQGAADEEIVGVIMAHNAKTILGIQDVFDQDFEMVVQKYMTIHSVSQQTNGCEVYPIAISNGARNILPGESLDARGEVYYGHTSSGYDKDIDPIGNLAQFDFPPNLINKPYWSDFAVRSGSRGVLPNENGNEGAIEGDIYVLYQEESFEWVFYGTSPISSTTALDMAWPGQSSIYDGYNNLFPNPSEGLHVGDRIKHSTNNTIENNSSRAVNAMESLQPHIGDEREILRSMRFPVVDIGDDGTGNLDLASDHFTIVGFIILKIHGYGTGTGTKAGIPFIVTEVVKVDYSCGQMISQ
ncbi:MAG: hypothetical protein ACI9EW_002581 [Cellvibrionaceae bacterium]|jgi:hypothetical protein